MDAEIVENEVPHGFERRAFDPTMVPVDIAVNCVDRSEQAGVNGFANVAEVRRPAGVLIDGEFDSHFVGQIGEAFADIEIRDKRLLAEDVLVRSQGRFDERGAIGGMGSDIDNCNIVVRQDFMQAVGRERVGIELIASFLRGRASCRRAQLRGSRHFCRPASAILKCHHSQRYRCQGESVWGRVVDRGVQVRQ